MSNCTCCPWRPDWRDATAYAEIPRSHLAWEFLRRNEEYAELQTCEPDILQERFMVREPYHPSTPPVAVIFLWLDFVPWADSVGMSASAEDALLIKHEHEIIMKFDLTRDLSSQLAFAKWELGNLRKDRKAESLRSVRDTADTATYLRVLDANHSGVSLTGLASELFSNREDSQASAKQALKFARDYCHNRYKLLIGAE